MSQNYHQLQLAQGFAQARNITRIHAATFYFASRFLRRPERNACYSVYAVCREADDAVDNSQQDARETLRRMKENIFSAYGGKNGLPPLLAAFRHTVETYGIPAEYFDELLGGMEMDLEKERYENFDRLNLYCYRVASVVGLIMLKIFRCDDERAQAPAIALGVAMQLTNIIRDIDEDYRRGRIYLPQDELIRFGINEDHLKNRIVDEKFIAFLRFQIERARAFYREAAGGIGLIPRWRQRYVVGAMKEIYAGILTAVERNHYDVFSQRASVSKSEKLKTAGILLAKGIHA